jgi:type IV pilus assembly protein PilA
MVTRAVWARHLVSRHQQRLGQHLSLSDCASAVARNSFARDPRCGSWNERCTVAATPKEFRCTPRTASASAESARRVTVDRELGGADLDSRGFTLVELLVAVAVIGILAAIAIPQFGSYRRRSFDASANADLRNAATAQEALFATSGAYARCRNASCEQRLPGFHRSKNVAIRMRRAAASFNGTSTHPNGSGKVWAYDSTAGGMQ